MYLSFKSFSSSLPLFQTSPLYSFYWPGDEAGLEAEHRHFGSAAGPALQTLVFLLWLASGASTVWFQGFWRCLVPEELLKRW